MLDLIDKGGLLIWPIVFCSLVGTTIFLERLLLYRKVHKHHKNLEQVYAMVHKGDFENARDYLRERSTKYSVARGILLEALGVVEPDRETLEMVLVRGVDRKVSLLSRYLGTLGVLGSTAPLLGLLGTVVGMIKAFMVVESMGGRVNASVLAGGIWEAMLTTAVGLSVAIPLIFFHNHLESQLQLLQDELQDVAIAFMKAWSRGHNLLD